MHFPPDMRAMGHTLVAEAWPRNGCAPSRVSYGPSLAAAVTSTGHRYRRTGLKYITRREPHEVPVLFVAARSFPVALRLSRRRRLAFFACELHCADTNSVVCENLKLKLKKVFNQSSRLPQARLLRNWWTKPPGQLCNAAVLQSVFTECSHRQ